MERNEDVNVVRRDTNRKQDTNRKIDLVLFAGQSNMSGRGDAGEAVRCSVDAGYEYKAVSRPGELVPIREPFGLGEDREGGIWDYDPQGRSKRSGSMVSAVAESYHAGTGRRIVGVSASVGGSDTVSWKQVYLADAVERLERAKEFLRAGGYSVQKLFVVWCQGESDGDAGRTAQEYTANLREIYGAFRAHGAEKCFLVQIGHYNYIKYPGTAGLTGKEWDQRYGIIRNAQADLCRTEEDFILAGSFEPYIHDMRDDYHYYQNAYNQVGTAVGEAIAGYVKRNAKDNVSGL